MRHSLAHRVLYEYIDVSGQLVDENRLGVVVVVEGERKVLDVAHEKMPNRGEMMQSVGEEEMEQVASETVGETISEKKATERAPCVSARVSEVNQEGLELLDALQAHLVALVHTSFGSRLALRVIAHATAKVLQTLALDTDNDTDTDTDNVMRYLDVT